MKVEDGGVHLKKYDGHCMKQQVRIPKATWKSPILRRRCTCLTYSWRVYLMKDDVKVMMLNRTPKTLILSDGVVNWDGGVEVWRQVKGWPCNAFLRLDGKTYHKKFDMETFIRRWYNWRGTYDVSVVYNGWKYMRGKMTNYRM
jgi:hypothetical protein